MEPHTAIDPTTEWCDDELDQLAETLGCTRALASRVARWAAQHGDELSAESFRRERLRFLNGICAEFMEVGGNMKVQFYSLMLVTGMARYFNIPSQQAAADRCGVCRATISHFVKRWQARLAILESEFTRPPETAARCRAARLRVVGKGEGNDPKLSDGGREAS